MIWITTLLGLTSWFVYANRWRFRLNCWSFNYDYDQSLDLILQKELNSGIRKITMIDVYHINIEFKSGVTMKAWNNNRYYAWLKDGNIGEFVWSNTRPSVETMVRLRDGIKQYFLR